MAFVVVVYDASVLYPNTLRDLLIRIAQAGLVQAKWTGDILDEMFAALQRNRPDIDDGTICRLRQLMLAAVRDSLVTGYEPLIDGSCCPTAVTVTCRQRRSAPGRRSSSPRTSRTSRRTS